MIIKVDSREKAPLPFKIQGNVTTVSTIGLPFGDYWASFENKDGSEGQDIPIMFERKSMADLYQTLSNADGIRLHKEKIKKAEAMDCKLYLIIEGSLSEAYKGVGYGSVEPDPLVKKIFTFKVKYGLEPIFCNNRTEMMHYMIETWEAFGRNFKHLALKTGLGQNNGTLQNINEQA